MDVQGRGHISQTAREVAQEALRNSAARVLPAPGGCRGRRPSHRRIHQSAHDEAIEAPRFFSYSVRGDIRPISLESRITEATIGDLKALGHEVNLREDYDKYFGGAQGILILRDDKIILGGADSRRDGYGAGY